MTKAEKLTDRQLEAALAQALGPEAGDTAPLSRAVLSRIAADAPASRPDLAEVLAAPLPMGGLLLSALILAGAFGHIVLSGNLTEAMTVLLLVGSGF